MEIVPQNEDPQQHHTSISYKPVQDHDHTLACVRADVYELSPATNDAPAKWYLKCSSEPLSLCYDSFRFMYRALCLKGTEIIVNSCIMPDSKISKTAPLFCTWNDDRTKKFLGFGFKQEVLIDTFIKAFEEAKKNMEELLSHIVPVNTSQFQSHSEPWQPILLNYNVAVQPQHQHQHQHQPQPQPQSEIITVLASSEGNRKANTAKSISASFSTKSATSRKVTAINPSENNKKSNAVNASSFDMRKGIAQEYQRKPRQQFSADPGHDMPILSRENIQFKQFIASTNTKIKELKMEFESLQTRNNIMQKSNEVLANNTNSLQTKCDEADKKRKHWKESAEKSERQQKDKLEESDSKRKTQLAHILEQRDDIKNRSEQQQIETSELQGQEETLLAILQDLHIENKAVTVTERKMQDDRSLIKTLTEEQLKDTVEVKNKIELTLQSLLETSVDIKNSIKKTAFIIDQNDKK